jgi:hypothetical protein
MQPGAGANKFQDIHPGEQRHIQIQDQDIRLGFLVQQRIDLWNQ